MNRREFRVTDICTSVWVAVAITLFVTPAIVAQPSANQLASQLEQLHAERISAIDELLITTVMTGGMFAGIESVTRYQKMEQDGREVLVEVDDEGGYGGVFEGLFEDVLGDLVRNSSEITNQTFDGFPVYRIFVDDADYLQELQTGEALADDEFDDFKTESATFYLDRDEMVVRHISFIQTGPEGESMTVNFTLSNYETFSGLPVPMHMFLELEGLEQMISEDELAEAREAMREMEAQLEQMPEAQRRMIEEQLMPQMQQFEAMLEQDELGKIEIEVTEVVVNP